MAYAVLKIGTTYKIGEQSSDSTTSGVLLGFEADDLPAAGVREGADFSELTVLITAQASTAADFVTARDAVIAQLNKRHDDITLEHTSGSTWFAMLTSTGAYTSIDCTWEMSPPWDTGTWFLATFRGAKAVTGAGGTGTEAPTGLQDEIAYSYSTDDTGLASISAQAAFAGNDGTDPTATNSATRRAQQWLVDIAATPPSALPANAKVVHTEVRYGTRNTEALAAIVWAASPRALNSHAQARTETWEVVAEPQTLDSRAGPSGYEVEVRVGLSYRQDKNTSMEPGTAVTRVTSEEMKAHADALIADALAYSGYTGMAETQDRQYDISATGSVVAAVARGVTSGGGIFSWRQSIETERSLAGRVERLSDGTDIVHKIAGGPITIQRLQVEVVAQSDHAVTLPSLSSRVVLLSETVMAPEEMKGPDGNGVTRYAYRATGRVLSSGSVSAASTAGISVSESGSSIGLLG